MEGWMEGRRDGGMDGSSICDLLYASASLSVHRAEVRLAQAASKSCDKAAGRVASSISVLDICFSRWSFTSFMGF